jgi:hypothetical protein
MPLALTGGHLALHAAAALILLLQDITFSGQHQGFGPGQIGMAGSKWANT